MAGGRPREHDREQIAIDMINWAKKADSINLCAFCCSCDPPMAPSKITIWAKECDEFRKAYETSKAFLGARREKMLNEEMLHVKAYDLNATTYDHFLKSERQQQSEFEANLSKGTQSNQANEAATAAVDKVLEQLKDLQASSSAKKMCEIKSKADSNS